MDLIMKKWFSKIAVLCCTTSVVLLTSCYDDTVVNKSTSNNVDAIPFSLDLTESRYANVDLAIAYRGEAVVYAQDLNDTIHAELTINNGILHGVINDVPVGDDRLVEITIFDDADSVYMKSLDTVDVTANDISEIWVDFKTKEEIEKEKTGTIVIKSDTTKQINDGENDNIPFLHIKELNSIGWEVADSLDLKTYYIIDWERYIPLDTPYKTDEIETVKTIIAKTLLDDKKQYKEIQISDSAIMKLCQYYAINGSKTVDSDTLFEDVISYERMWFYKNEAELVALINKVIDETVIDVVDMDEVYTYEELYNLTKKIADTLKITLIPEINWTLCIPVDKEYTKGDYGILIDLIIEKLEEAKENYMDAVIPKETIRLLIEELSIDVVGLPDSFLEINTTYVSAQLDELWEQTWTYGRRSQLIGLITEIANEYLAEM